MLFWLSSSCSLHLPNIGGIVNDRNSQDSSSVMDLTCLLGIGLSLETNNGSLIAYFKFIGFVKKNPKIIDSSPSLKPALSPCTSS